MRPPLEIIEHPGEVRLRLRAATPGDLAIVAGRALAELELGRAPGPAVGSSREIVVQGRDREAVLVHWLNELIYTGGSGSVGGRGIRGRGSDGD
jgi:SHS2 domain-containing protein